MIITQCIHNNMHKRQVCVCSIFRFFLNLSYKAPPNWGAELSIC